MQAHKMAESRLRHWKRKEEEVIWVLIIGVVLFLLVGPLRRLFFAAWRFTFPSFVGATLAMLVSAKIVNAGAPALIMFIAPIMAFFMIGAAGKQWLDSNLGSPKR